MKSKLTIVLAVLLLAILAMPHTADAQDGYNVSKVRGLDNVIATGNNQAVPAVVLTSRTTTDEPQVERDPANDVMLSVKFGDLPIVQATAWTVSADGATVAPIAATSGDFDDATNADIQFKVGAKELLIFIPDGAPTTGGGVGVTDDTMIKLADIRLDLTSMAAGGSVPITVTSSDQADTIGLGGGVSGSVSATLTTAADGLGVAAAKGNGLTCGTIEGASVTVSEGFARAWNPTLMVAATNGVVDGGKSHATDEDAVGGAVQIRLDVVNFPDNEGAKIEWPASVKDNRTDTDPAATGDQTADIATLTLDTENSDANGKFAIYTYADVDSVDTIDNAADPTNPSPTDPSDDTGVGLQRFLNDATRSFPITGIGFKNFGGAAIDVTAQLWPAAKRNSDGKKNAADVKSVLSFEHAAEDPTYAKDARAGAWVIVEDCVTYLLYPFVTCGATSGWTTGISVSNTSKDDGVFGAFDETTDQKGGVVFYGFPRGAGAEPVVGMLTSELAAGDTHTFSCDNSVMAGMEGYAIIKANFQHARGMGFVLGNFADGAAIDVSHGYMAEAFSDPNKRSETLP